MKRYLLSLAAFALAGAAFAGASTNFHPPIANSDDGTSQRKSVTPDWFYKPNHVIDVRWVRAYSTVPELKDGVCTIFMADTNEQDYRVAHGQIDHCLAKGEPVTTKTPQPGVVRVHLHYYKRPYEVDQRYNELFHRASFAYSDTLGFAHTRDSVCTVVAARDDSLGYIETTVGHELKHCFDGAWHHGDGTRILAGERGPRPKLKLPPHNPMPKWAVRYPHHGY